MLRLTQTQGKTFKGAKGPGVGGSPPRAGEELIAVEMWEAFAGVLESERRAHSWKTLPTIHICVL